MLFRSDDAGLKGEDIAHFIIPSTFGMKFITGLTKKCGLNPEIARDTLVANCGETGTAHALVMLINTLQTEAKPGDKVLVAQFGGGCDALIFEVTDKLSTMSGKRGKIGRASCRERV